ncbi:hypothetical protein MRB53_022884 [Persea americana]|uniref:Uncharacterized protein n=1 Tax=Persea americana TaxID=3435 RepID=A0ACC2L7Q8_PERAE|nr:hypothetical protein MRB53_022884 [Persea americana]
MAGRQTWPGLAGRGLLTRFPSNFLLLISTYLRKRKSCAASSRSSLCWLCREAAKEEETSSVDAAYQRALAEKESFARGGDPWLWRRRASQEGRERAAKSEA